MKVNSALLATLGTVGITSAAFGGVPPPPGPNDYTFNLANHTFATQASTTAGSAIQTETAVIPGNQWDILGITIQFDYTENPADASYASDFNLQILGANVNAHPQGGATGFTFGGGSYGNLSSWGVRDFTWDYTGSISSPAGHYSHTTILSAPLSKGQNQTWTFNWHAFYNAGVTYSNVQVTLHKAIPTPGALALLGMAGLTGARRRRR